MCTSSRVVFHFELVRAPAVCLLSFSAKTDDVNCQTPTAMGETKAAEGDLFTRQQAQTALFFAAFLLYYSCREWGSTISSSSAAIESQECK